MGAKPPKSKAAKKPTKRGRPAAKSSPSRAKAKKPKAKRAPAKKARPKKRPSKKGRAWTRGWRGRLLRTMASVGLGLCLGTSVVVWVLYEQALRDVDALLATELWAKPGKVLSGPLEVWPGLELTPAELAGDLQAAGYARVNSPSKPGDFGVGAERVLVYRVAAEGPGWRIPEGQVEIRFAAGRVSKTSVGTKAHFAPAQLAGVRGPDNESRNPVTLEDMPEHMVQAVLAMEDARFRSHEGLDPLGIARALLVNAVRGQTVQGGSTLTQQVVKNLFLSHERTVERKAREALLSIALEERRSKDEILSLYLNEIYLGQVAGAAVCGVDQAARAYFGKPVGRVNLAEAATLAGIVSAPNRYSPLRHPERALERRALALERLADLGWADPKAVAAAKESPLSVHPPTSGRSAPWLVDAAIEAIETSIPDASVAGQGLVVHTTLQPALQRLAERSVAAGLLEVEMAHPELAGVQAALVAIRVRDGAVVAMVGGRDYGSSQFNRALYGARQVGSTIKPLTALVGFEERLDLSPATRFVDAPIERVVAGKTWSPGNYDGRHVGPISLREAITHSRNVPAVLLAEEIGLGRLKREWRALGLSRATDHPSASLGSFLATPIELASAYAVFPGAGRQPAVRFVTAASRANGSLLWQNAAVGQQRTSARAAFLATSMLQEVIADGTGRKAQDYGVRQGAGGKTGTTDDGRDAWFVGFTPELSVAVWVGFDKGRNLGLTGGQAALPTWARFVAATGTATGRFGAPEGVESHAVCVLSGAPADPACPETTTDWFTEGAVPLGGCPDHGGLLEPISDTAASAWDQVKDVLRPGREKRKKKGRRKR